MATTWYFDSLNGRDTNSGTEACPKQHYANFNSHLVSPGDTFLFKRGTTQVASQKGVFSGSSDTVRTRYGVYGEGRRPYSIWRYSGANDTFTILNATGSKYIDFEDMYFDMTESNCRNSVFCNLATVGIHFRRCFFRGANTPGAKGGGNGLNILQGPTSSASPREHKLEDCEFFDNETHGLIIVGGQDIRVLRCKFYNNGLKSDGGGHGFSAKWNHSSVAWCHVDINSNIYRHDLAIGEANAEQDVHYISALGQAHKVRPTAKGNETTPAPMEYGVAKMGNQLQLFINLGGNDPAKSGVTCAFENGRCSGLWVEQCESYGNHSKAQPPHEGHGFALDDVAQDSRFVGNLSHHNEGAGFSINGGDRNRLIANVAHSNGQSGVVCNPADDTWVINNTFFNNNKKTDDKLGPNGEILFNPFCRNGVVTNNIIIAEALDDNCGVRLRLEKIDGSNNGFTGSNNAIIMRNKLDVAIPLNFLTNFIFVDPALDANYKPGFTQAGIHVDGVDGFHDFYGNPFRDPPSIGAVEDRAVTCGSEEDMIPASPLCK